MKSIVCRSVGRSVGSVAVSMYVDVGLATVALLAGLLATSSSTGASPPRSLITGRPLVNGIGIGIEKYTYIAH